MRHSVNCTNHKVVILMVDSHLANVISASGPTKEEGIA
jgi:hypothetical protein